MTDLNIRKDRHIERIRKLLALSGSSNPHESEIARKRAEALMEKYAISHMDLGQAELGSSDFVTDTKARDPWKVRLFGSIGFIFGCQVTFRINKNKKQTITFYGKKPSVDLALYISDVVIRSIKSKWDDFKKQVKAANITLSRNSKDSFYLAFADGVAVVIRDMYQGMNQAEQEAHKEEVSQTDHLTKKFSSFRSGKVSLKSRDNLALTEGYKSGRSQCINIGLGSNSRSSIVKSAGIA